MDWYNLLKDFLQAFASRLTDQEKEILLACAENGEIRKCHVSNYGDWIRSGTKDFFDKADPAIAARYLEALTRLLARGYAAHQKDTLYKLTGSGFDAARRLKAAADSKNRPIPKSP
jgi:hypothetical protein